LTNTTHRRSAWPERNSSTRFLRLLRLLRVEAAQRTAVSILSLSARLLRRSLSRLSETTSSDSTKAEAVVIRRHHPRRCWLLLSTTSRIDMLIKRRRLQVPYSLRRCQLLRSLVAVATTRILSTLKATLVTIAVARRRLAALTMVAVVVSAAAWYQRRAIIIQVMLALFRLTRR
jgi:hypothetical protein